MRYPSTAPEIIGGALHAAVDNVERERRVALERTLAPEVAMLRGCVSTVDPSVSVGLPAAEILRYADVADSDLLVVGARSSAACRSRCSDTPAARCSWCAAAPSETSAPSRRAPA